MLVDDFDFHLPEQLIAQDPPPQRGGSRLMVLTGGGPESADDGRESAGEHGSITHAMFADLANFLQPGDLLVVNDTRVVPARLLGRRLPGGGAVECLLLGRVEDEAGSVDQERPDRAADHARYLALMHPGQRLKPGARMVFERDGSGIEGEVLGRHFGGRRTVLLRTLDGSDLASAIDRIGHIPLPPYIRREDTPADRDRYQTVYARERGSIAAPTAGLHFGQAILEGLASRGVRQVSVTLHVGYGTFKPVRVARVEDHRVDPEQFVVPEETAVELTTARREGRRIIAVGTTTVRALESLGIDDDGRIAAARGSTGLFISPGHRFRIVSGLITNFHLPRSSLLMLVAAFAGREQILTAYREAVANRYRFYSYGDAMLIL